MAKRPLSLTEKLARRQFNLINKVGLLGRQGVKGPVEQSEKRILSPTTKKKKK